MPLAFPSHQGLIAPLWRKWPKHFEPWACSIGAAMPDIVEGVRAIFTGHLGQAIGHSTIGLFLIDVPAGLAILFAVRRKLTRAQPISMLAGAFSHLFFDFISHDKFLWLYPFKEIDFFPAWWTQRWLEIKTPFYERPYPVGPHFIVWTILSIAGAVMFFYRRKPASTS